MNISQSLRQTIAEARNNPAFTALYIGGVAFAVAFTMIYAIIYYVRLAPVYPEYNRSTTLNITHVSIRNEGTSSQSISSIGLPFIKGYLEKLENKDYIAITGFPYEQFVQPVDGSGDIRTIFRMIDPQFFKLYEYEFLGGRRFSDEEFESGLKVAVITSDLASRLYGSVEEAVGKEISIDYRNYKIVGVVRPGSSIFDTSFAQAFVPYTSVIGVSSPSASSLSNPNEFLGEFSVFVKLKDADQSETFKTELDDMLRRINAADTTGWRTSLPTVSTNAETVFKVEKDEDGSGGSLMKSLKPYLTLLLVLLIIPAINISGMIGGQMDRRMAEMGLRRSFGASKRELCRQVMFENLLLTLAGGLIGLVVAWIVLYCCKSWILGLISESWRYLGNVVEPEITTEMLFAPAVFLGSLLICVALNVISAYIPVKFALRKPIVSSINVKK